MTGGEVRAMERQEGAMVWWPPEAAGGRLVPEPGLTRRTLLGAGLAATAAGMLGVCTAGGLPASGSAGERAGQQADVSAARAAAAAEGAAADPAIADVPIVGTPIADASLAGAPSSDAPGAQAASGGRPAFAPLLAQDWSPGRDPSGWLVSEKLDGVRALWDGERMFFRSGRALALPAVIRRRLPSEPLDGELWLGRGRFEDISALLRSDRVADEAAWRAVQYHVFELPAGSGRFAERAARLQQIAVASAWPGLVAAPQQTVADAAALQRRLDAVVAAGGEGLMLHRADAPVANGRSPWLCKFKPLHDAEAVVIGHRAGRGKHQGRLGALQVRADDGQVFYLGTGFTDAQRAAPPAVGTRVTFSHHGRTDQGVPRFARFMRQAPAF
jgi:DNA ligase-1